MDLSLITIFSIIKPFSIIGLGDLPTKKKRLLEI